MVPFFVLCPKMNKTLLAVKYFLFSTLCPCRDVQPANDRSASTQDSLSAAKRAHHEQSAYDKLSFLNNSASSAKCPCEMAPINYKLPSPHLSSHNGVQVDQSFWLSFCKLDHKQKQKILQYEIPIPSTWKQLLFEQWFVHHWKDFSSWSQALWHWKLPKQNKGQTILPKRPNLNLLIRPLQHWWKTMFLISIVWRLMSFKKENLHKPDNDCLIFLLRMCKKNESKPNDTNIFDITWY